MAERFQNDWTKFSVGSTPKARDCDLLLTVSHVTHVQHALTVLRDGYMMPQLIYDESRLMSERIQVIWLSPNDWHPAGGFRYGNIAFDFEWTSLVNQMRAYWVGAMQYSPWACRILITDKDRDDQLMPYDQSKRDGPWWHSNKSGKHYWNGEHCLEFMVEDKLHISQVSKLRFVKHHAKRCSIDYRTCKDCGQESDQAAARLLAGACSQRLLDKHQELWVKKDKPNDALGYAWLILLITFGNVLKPTEWTGPIKVDSKQAKALVRAALGAYCERAGNDRKQLLSLFASKSHAIEAAAKVVEQDLDLKPGSLKRKT